MTLNIVTLALGIAIGEIIARVSLASIMTLRMKWVYKRQLKKHGPGPLSREQAEAALTAFREKFGVSQEAVDG